MLIFDYPSKKVMKESIGRPLRYRETSMFGDEYAEGKTLTGCNRPHITGHKREFFANAVVRDGKLAEVK